MNQRPPPQPQGLDAEERALAKALPRLHGRTTPGPDIDAGILAAAQAAVQPARPAHRPIRPRVRWIAPTALAASMVLAVGMAWQLRPLPTLETSRPQPQSDASEVPAAAMIEPEADDQPLRETPSKPVPLKSIAPDRQQDSPAVSERAAAPAMRELRAQSSMPPPPPPAPLPAPPAPAAAPPSPAVAIESAAPAATLDTVTSERVMRARDSAPAPAANASSGALAREKAPVIADKASMADSVGQALPKTARAAPSAASVPEVRNEADMAADAGFVGDPGEDIPPATAASPAVRDAWLHRIGELLDQGKRQEAKASLAEFRRRYPAVVLPPALRALEIEP